MAKKKGIKLTRIEMRVMEIIWQLKTAAVREIIENLPVKNRPVYTTVQTTVNRLEEKGAIRRVRKIGNALIFEPTITREEAHHSLINDLIDLMGGSAWPLMSHLVESEKVTVDDLKKLEIVLARMKEEQSAEANTQAASNQESTKKGKTKRQ